jgi:hypothetical protein
MILKGIVTFRVVSASPRGPCAQRVNQPKKISGCQSLRVNEFTFFDLFFLYNLLFKLKLKHLFVTKTTQIPNKRNKIKKSYLALSQNGPAQHVASFTASADLP